MAGIEPAAVTSDWRVTDKLDGQEEADWRQSKALWKEMMLADSHRRQQGESVVTEKALADAQEQLSALHNKLCRPAEFGGDMAGKAPPVKIDDLAQQPGAEDEELLAMQAAHPIGGQGASDEHLALGDPWALAGAAWRNSRAMRAIIPIEQRLIRAKLSCTEFCDVEHFRVQTLPSLCVASTRDDTVVTFGVYGNWSVTCKLVHARANTSLQLERYVFVATSDLGHA